MNPNPGAAQTPRAPNSPVPSHWSTADAILPNQPGAIPTAPIGGEEEEEHDPNYHDAVQFEQPASPVAAPEAKLNGDMQLPPLQFKPSNNTAPAAVEQIQVSLSKEEADE